MRGDSSIFSSGLLTLLLIASTNVFAGDATPDISGVWMRMTADGTQAVAAPPLKKQYSQLYQASRAQAAHTTRASAGNLEPCKVEGMPAVMGAREPLEILQTPGQVSILAEYMSQTRRIFTDTKLPPLEEVNPGYMGFSAGKWHNGILEVETIGIRDDIRYQGIPHSANMRILEKIHLTAPDQLEDEMTIIDADALTQPYQLKFSYRKDPQHRVLEYECRHPGAQAAALQEKRSAPTR